MLGVPVGERLPVAPRERKPALAALAVLLILVGALGATLLVMRAGDRVAAVKVVQPVAAGEVVTDSDITEVMVAADSGVHYVKWSQRGILATYRAQTDLVAGTVLVGEMLGKTDTTVAKGKVVVGLSLKQGQFPPGLKSGDTVAAYEVGTDAAKSSGSVALTSDAKIKSVPGASDGGISSGDSQYSVIVSESDAGALTLAASAGNVALVLVPAATG
jgi:hypothetical protein